jgi:hypothetical protein
MVKLKWKLKARSVSVVDTAPPSKNVGAPNFGPFLGAFNSIISSVKGRASKRPGLGSISVFLSILSSTF